MGIRQAFLDSLLDQLWLNSATHYLGEGLDTDMWCPQKNEETMNFAAVVWLNRGLKYVRVEPYPGVQWFPPSDWR